MSYALLTYQGLLEEIEGIKLTNIDALEKNAQFFESTVEALAGTNIEYFSKNFDGYRILFQQVENFFEDIQLELEQEKISLGLVERVSSFGEKAENSLFAFRSDVDKEVLNSIEELREVLNEWYAVIGNNLLVLSDLRQIAYVLNSNFRHVEPLNELGVESIATQSKDGITVTKNDEIYINGTAVKLEGQRKKIMLLLIDNYIKKPDLAVSWMTIEPEIREDENILERPIVVNRVSELRRRLATEGYDSNIIEIKNLGRGLEASWGLVKH